MWWWEAEYSTKSSQCGVSKVVHNGFNKVNQYLIFTLLTKRERFEQSIMVRLRLFQILKQKCLLIALNTKTS